MRSPCAVIAALALASLAQAQELREFSSKGLPRSEGIVVRVSHPPQWGKVASDDPMVLAELQGPQGPLTGVLQVGRGQRREDMESLCRPERARTMLQGIADAEPGARVTEVFARRHEGRPAFEIRYEKKEAPTFTAVRSVIVCLQDSQLVVSCGGAGEAKHLLAGIEPVCRRVLDSLTVSEQ